MNLFLKKIIVIVFISSVTFIIFYILSCQIMNNTSSFKIDGHISKLIMGDSQAECSYNDLFIENTLNIADSGESYFYTYFKLKKIVEDNQQISKVYLEFSNNKIFKNEEEKIWGKNYLSRLKNYASLIPIKEQLFLLKKSGKVFLNPFLRAFNNNLIHLISLKTSYHKDRFGGYLKLKDSKIGYINTHKDSLANIFLKREFFNVEDFKKTNSYRYLKKIINLCKEKRIEIILVRSPKNSCYLMINSEIAFQKNISQFKDVTFLDFKDFFLEDDAYRDCEHLNSTGAKIFSSYFNKTQI